MVVIRGFPRPLKNAKKRPLDLFSYPKARSPSDASDAPPRGIPNGVANDAKSGANVNAKVNVNAKRKREDTAWSESTIDKQLGPPDRRLLKGATTNLQTMMHVFKGNVGPGILAMPYAFANVGLIPGLVIQC